MSDKAHAPDRTTQTRRALLRIRNWVDIPPPAGPSEIPVLHIRWDVYQDQLRQAREQGRAEARDG